MVPWGLVSISPPEQPVLQQMKQESLLRLLIHGLFEDEANVKPIRDCLSDISNESISKQIWFEGQS